MKIIWIFFISIFLIAAFVFLSQIDENSNILRQKNIEITYPQKRKLSENQTEAQKFYDSQTHTIKLLGSFDLGYYYTNLFVGTPPQKQTVIVDTGSSLTAFPCSDCSSHDCGNHIDPHFNTKTSSTFSPIDCSNYVGNFRCRSCDNTNKRCTFGISYQEGSSLNGYLASDYVVLGDDLLYFYENRNQNLQNEELQKYISEQKVNFTFGCTTRETNLFYTQRADGILGLGINTNSSSNLPNLIDSTYKQHQEINERLAFSLCFGYDGGYMTIGGYNSDKHLPNATVNIVPYKGRGGQYVVNIYKAKIGDKELPLNFDDFNYDQGSFIDSGTTMFYAHSKIHNTIMSEFNNFCNADSSHCVNRAGNCFYYNKNEYPYIGDFFRKFPPLSFQMENDVVFTWYPEDYLYKDRNSYCLPFNELPGRVILGGIFMRHYDILFDRGSQNIHFTRSNCSDEYKGPYFNDNIDFKKGEQKNNINKEISEKKVKENEASPVILWLAIFALVLVIFGLICYFLRRRKLLLLAHNVQADDLNSHKITDGDSEI